MTLSKVMEQREIVLPAVVLAGTIGVVWTIHTIRAWRRTKSKQVPGPRGWPVVGYMPYLLPANLHNNMKHLINKYMDLLPRSWLGIDAMEEGVNRIFEYFEGIVKEHRESFNPDDLRDYTDRFLYEQQKRQGDDNSTFTDDQLLVSMSDLFLAGGETTSTTIRWAVLLLSYHPEIQRKMQEEIDSVVGRDRLPSLDDRERMPYTEAILHEVQRFADIAPMGVFHSNNEKDVEFEGFLIPKGTAICGYVGDCHRSKKYWAKPKEFYPEHFLDANGQLKHDVEGFLPFSIGKRRCIGENLTRVELFYFITYFFQVFNFTLCPNPKPSVNADPKSGLVRWPSPYKVILESR